MDKIKNLVREELEKRIEEKETQLNYLRSELSEVDNLEIDGKTYNSILSYILMSTDVNNDPTEVANYWYSQLVVNGTISQKDINPLYGSREIGWMYGINGPSEGVAAFGKWEER